jgi:hypothetical protein
VSASSESNSTLVEINKSEISYLLTEEDLNILAEFDAPIKQAQASFNAAVVFLARQKGFKGDISFDGKVIKNGKST